jgi:queuine tRNA-ribosyltransferase
MSESPFRFRLEASSGRARAATLETPHGPIHTPAFMPVGTHGAVKALTPDQVRAAGAEMVLANTYHLTLRPGEGTVAKLGGLHAFMCWDGPILTDSGGFQVFSLPTAEISDRGVRFRNELDGSELVLTPERSIEIQNCARTLATTRRCSASCRAAPTPTCARAVPRRWSRSTCRATRSAACRSARATSCSAA